MSTKSTNNTFSGNCYLGTFKDKPVDAKGSKTFARYQAKLNDGAANSNTFNIFLIKVKVGDGATTIHAIN